MTIVEKIDWVADRIEELWLSPKALAHTICDINNLEKAYRLFKKYPNITKEEYLEIMDLEE